MNREALSQTPQPSGPIVAITSTSNTIYPVADIEVWLHDKLIFERGQQQFTPSDLSTLWIVRNTLQSSMEYVNNLLNNQGD